MSRYQDIYDGMEESKKRLAEAKREERIERIGELAVEIEAVSHAMDQELFRSHWEKLKKIHDRLSEERQKLLKKI